MTLKSTEITALVPFSTPTPDFVNYNALQTWRQNNMQRTPSSKQVLVLLIVAAGVAAFVYTSHVKRQEIRNEMLTLTAELSKRQHSQEEVRQLLRESRFRDLTLYDEPSDVWAVEAPMEFGAKNWVLYMDISDSKVVGLRVRISDTPKIHPDGAPPDNRFIP